MMGSNVKHQTKLEKPHSSHESASKHRSHSKNKKASSTGADKASSEKNKKKSQKHGRENGLSRSHSEKNIVQHPQNRRMLLAKDVMGKSATLSRRNLMNEIKPQGKTEQPSRGGRPGMIKSGSKKSLLAGAEKLGKGLMILADDVLDLVLDDDTGQKKREKRIKEREIEKRSKSPVPGRGLVKSGSRRSLMGGLGGSTKNLMEMEKKSKSPVPGRGLVKSGSRRSLMGGFGGSTKNLMGGSKRNLLSGDLDRIERPKRSGSMRNLMSGMDSHSDENKHIVKNSNHKKEAKKKGDRTSRSKEPKKKDDRTSRSREPKKGDRTSRSKEPKKKNDHTNPKEKSEKKPKHPSPSPVMKVKKKAEEKSGDKQKVNETVDGADVKNTTKAAKPKEGSSKHKVKKTEKAAKAKSPERH